MKHCLTLLVAIMSLAATDALAAPPVWEGYPKLICRGEMRASCSTASLKCTNVNSEALWAIDFSTKQVRYLTLHNEIEAIIATHQSLYRSTTLHDIALLSSGRMIDFTMAKDTHGSDQIKATMLGSSEPGQADVTTFTCAAPN